MCLANHIKHSIKVMAKTNRKKRSPFDPPATFGEQTGAHDQKPNLISFIVWRESHCRVTESYCRTALKIK